jgi:hypothetical protein
LARFTGGLETDSGDADDLLCRCGRVIVPIVAGSP